jgi:ABC-type phosphate transport system permease subunit
MERRHEPVLLFFWLAVCVALGLLAMAARELCGRGMETFLSDTLLPAAGSTMALCSLALLFAAPPAVAAAVYFFAFPPAGPWSRALHLAWELLSAVPSVIWGLFGFLFFGNYLRFGSFLSASLTLALVLLPEIQRSTEAALAGVPAAYQKASQALGATSWRTLREIVLPQAGKEIIAGLILALRRGGRNGSFTFALRQPPADAGPRSLERAFVSARCRGTRLCLRCGAGARGNCVAAFCLGQVR